MNPPSEPPYQVALSGAIRELLVQLHESAAADGRRDEFLAALRNIDARLRTDPATFGEEVFDLLALQLTVRVGIVLPLAVEFAVYPQQRFVYIRTFRYITSE